MLEQSQRPLVELKAEGDWAADGKTTYLGPECRRPFTARRIPNFSDPNSLVFQCTIWILVALSIAAISSCGHAAAGLAYSRGIP
jgi:hypothetical protein